MIFTYEKDIDDLAAMEMRNLITLKTDVLAFFVPGRDPSKVYMNLVFISHQTYEKENYVPEIAMWHLVNGQSERIKYWFWSSLCFLNKAKAEFLMARKVSFSIF